MDPTEQAFENEILARGVSAPRLTPQDIDAVIVSEDYHLVATTTICTLTLRNGFTVTGTACCADPRNFEQRHGERRAREDARKHIWPLENYLLRQRLFEASLAPAGATLSYTAVRAYHDPLREKTVVEIDDVAVRPADRDLLLAQVAAIVHQNQGDAPEQGALPV